MLVQKFLWVTNGGEILKVRALVDLLPFIEVVEGDSFNSDPQNPAVMGPDAFQRYSAGEELPVVKAKTPLVSIGECLS